MKSDSCNKMTCPRDGYKMCQSLRLVVPSHAATMLTSIRSRGRLCVPCRRLHRRLRSLLPPLSSRSSVLRSLGANRSLVWADCFPLLAFVAGPCTECDLCDLYLLPDEDDVIRQAGDKARQAWIKRKRAANLNGGDRGWVNGMRVGPLDERGRSESKFFLSPASLATYLRGPCLRNTRPIPAC